MFAKARVDQRALKNNVDLNTVDGSRFNRLSATAVSVLSDGTTGTSCRIGRMGSSSLRTVQRTLELGTLFVCAPIQWFRKPRPTPHKNEVVGFPAGASSSTQKGSAFSYRTG